MWLRFGELITARGAQQDLYDRRREVTISVCGVRSKEVQEVTDLLEDFLNALEREDYLLKLA